MRTLHASLSDEELTRIQAAIAPVTQVEAVRSLLLWYADQDELIRREILGLLPRELRPDIARLVLERMAARPKKRRR